MDADCILPLKTLLQKQDIDFKAMKEQIRNDIATIEAFHGNIRSQASSYFAASESAEKLIFNYQELKLHTIISYDKRKAMHASVVNQYNLAKDSERKYKDLLPDANERLVLTIQKFKDYQEKLKQCEEKRCEQVFSSIGQFIVFEKQAEMNNKYDVKNFSALLDSFNLEKEVAIIEEEIKKQIEAGTQRDQRQTIFDPVVEEGGQKAAYSFTPYAFKKFNIGKMASDNPLLGAPPVNLLCHEDKAEVLNCIFHKAFAHQSLYFDHKAAAQHLFKEICHRHSFMQKIEEEYKGYDLDWRQPHLATQKGFKVILPTVVFSNLTALFQILLQAAWVDENTDVKAKAQEVMRVMLFAHIFYKQQYSFTPDPSSDQKLMLFLANWTAWCDPELWKNIAAIRLSFEKEEAQASSSKEESKDAGSPKEFDAGAVMEEVIQDMYLCSLTKLTVSQLLTQIGEIEGLVTKE